MSSKQIDVFIVCSAKSIARGSAKAFRLSRLDETGTTRPFSIAIIRTEANGFFGYINTCPHEGVWLNIGAGEFFSPDRRFLKCGRHGAIFEIETGLCVDGPCKGQSLEPVALAVIDEEVCLCGIALVEEDGLGFDDLDDTMEIMIHPD